MTRKDYRMVAQAIKDELSMYDIDADIRHSIWRLANRMCGVFAVNPNFEPERFMEACGL